MKKKFLKVYLGIYSLFVFVTSFMYLDGLIFNLNLPKGALSSIAHYAFLLIHFGSFAAMLYYGKEL